MKTTLHRVGAALLALLIVCASVAAVTGAGAAQASEISADVTEQSDERYSAALLEAVKGEGLTRAGGVQTYSEGPGFIIHYENGSASSLQSWADDSTERSVKRHDTTGRWMLIAAPTAHIGTSGTYRTVGKYVSPKLAHRDYVEFVDVNRRLSYSEPITQLKEESSYDTPRFGTAATSWRTSASFEQQGVAYRDDSNRTTMAEARASVNADSTTTSASSTTVAVIDTGLSYNEGLYGRRVIAAKNTLSNNSADITIEADGLANVSQSDYSNVSDGNGHGSFVTSEIAANSSNNSYDGVAPNSRIISAKALSDKGEGSTTSIAAALEYTCSEGADVVSMSLGGYVPQPTLQEKISECYSEHGVSAVVIAVGNERQSARWVATPADSTEELPVISVGATNGEPPADAQSAYFSNVGPDPMEGGASPTVAAPGMQIVTQTEQEGLVASRELSGTSMAAPIVSGVLLLALAEDSSLQGSPTELRSRVERTASPVPAAGETEVGAGMINATQLLSNTEPEQTQSSARTESARSRDAANGALSGSLLRQLFGGEN